MAVIHFNADPYTAEQLAVRDTPVRLTTSNIFPPTGPARGLGAVMAFVTLEASGHTTAGMGDVRFHIANKTAATGCGHIMYVGDSLVLDGWAQMQFFNVVNTSGGTSTIVVTYFCQ